MVKMGSGMADAGIVLPISKPPYTSCRRFSPECCAISRERRHKIDRKRSRQLIKIALNMGAERKLV